MDTRDNGDSRRVFLEIPDAAILAGFSLRHFRRIIRDEHIPIVRIRRKFFILGSEFERWQAARARDFLDVINRENPVKAPDVYRTLRDFQDFS